MQRKAKVSHIKHIRDLGDLDPDNVDPNLYVVRCFVTRSSRSQSAVVRCSDSII